MHLLDVSVLIALCDSAHVHFAKATAWFKANAVQGWATCPITENGLLRILGHPNYPGTGAGSPAHAAIALGGMIQAVPGHHFLPDDLSLLTPPFPLGATSSARLTDVYLLALAVRHGVRFLTLDQHLDPSSVPGGPAALEVLQ